MTTLHSYHDKILVEQDDRITTVTLNASASKNACTAGMWVAIGRTFRDLAYSGTRAIILTGSGGDFCAGADLTGGGEEAPPSGTMVDGMRVLADVVLAIHDCPVPVISKVDGVCVGAGLGLCLATDLTWCSDRARFSAIFAKRGLSLDFGTSWLLRERVGVHKAKEIAFTAKMLNAAQAYDLGLVNTVVPLGDLDQSVDELAHVLAEGPPGALSIMKRQIDNASGVSLAQALETEALAQGVNVKTHDMREALTAYVEKRPPHFEGR